ncbi:mitochondrial calcium uniporter regulator 1 isoform X2 [Gymnodraco acuticeps]|uniref:Mitochondrial calcium uniporter regulator 1 isoform X2 n=1 Tax=Gymnodraco acuticeps TaxID=8218 RepID=A0A6P8U950_GYMAC|nr:mitochondrial calcium uniporter regulator 1 [Pseudochaenichthys georgianus]XP_034067840.1 mitochondrial calcium uniporter regulator 1 isoform X2 [Gymnodraco acuticeps]
MVLKQCHSRLKLGVNHQEKWYDLSFNQGRVNSVMTATISSNMSCLTAANTLPCVRCIITQPFRSFEKPVWRGRHAGQKIVHLSAGTYMTARGLSTSIPALQHLDRSVPKSEGGKLLFDTHAVVRLFEENGFTTQQAEVIVKILVKMTTSNMDVIYSDMVTKVQQEIMLQRLMSQIASVKKDMLILEKSEFSTLLAENEKLKNELLHIKIQLADVMNKLRSDTIMDMNLEKSRSKELKIENEKLLLETRTEIMEMTAEQDRHLTQTNMKIDTEVAGLKTMLESHKLDTIKYLAGSVFTCLTVVLGFYRIWM